MSTDYRPPSTCHVREAERGSIALVALAVMLVLAVLGMALVYFVRGGATNTHEYLREMQLETAAKAAIAETGHLVTSKEPQIENIADNARAKIAVLNYGGSDSYSDGYTIKVTVTAMRQGSYIYLIACAIEQVTEVSYERREFVKGVWLKNDSGENVYQGWAP